MIDFTSTAFQRNPGNIFNEVQASGFAGINHKARPDMVLMLKTEQNALIEKVRQLTELVKAGDSHLQEDLLK